jgi:hypothetical protein
MVTTERVRVDNLCVDTMQSRDDPWVGDDQDHRLTASVAQTGLLQDLLVRPVDQLGNAPAGDARDAEYAIIAGSRRYYAAMEAGHERVRCKVLDATDIGAAWQSLAENTDRRSLSEQEIAQQLRLIYEMVRPVSEIESCPECGTAVDGETGLTNHCRHTDCPLPAETVTVDGDDDILFADPAAVTGQSVAEAYTADGRFVTDRQAVAYLAEGFLGRSDHDARDVVAGHLRTAELPPVLQAMFKDPSERSAAETTALDNYNVDTTTRLGSGEGKSGTSREVVALHRTVADTFDDDALDPTNAVLRTVGSLQFDEMSEQELRRTLRSFRQEIDAAVDVSQSPDTQREVFADTLETHSTELREMYEQIEPHRPFKKVDVLGPETERHSRWHARVMQRRDVSGHGDLVRQLYQERLKALADQEGWG